MTSILSIENFGQIRKGSITFADLTVLVGPQASGKSIALQLLKLAIDAGQVQDEMGRYGLDWSAKLNDFLDVYFGEGMHAIWRVDLTRFSGHITVTQRGVQNVEERQ
jgi:DNA repair ATPase RecN